MTALFAIILTSCDKEDKNLKEFTVSFETGDGDSTVSPQKVKEGEKVIKPDNPTRSGYTFFAWYKEAALTNEWNFDTEVVTTNITLYAKWDEDDDKNNSMTVSGTIFGECASWDEMRVSFDLEKTWIATAPIQNEKFSLILPKPDAELLYPVPDDTFPKEVTVSDKTAKFFNIVIFRVFKGSTKSNDPFLLMGETSKGLCMVDWFYVDKNVNITGSYTDDNGMGRVYNVRLEKGWNVWLSYESKTLNEYGKVTMTYEIGNVPDGVKWFETPISFD